MWGSLDSHHHSGLSYLLTTKLSGKGRVLERTVLHKYYRRRFAALRFGAALFFAVFRAVVFFLGAAFFVARLTVFFTVRFVVFLAVEREAVLFLGAAFRGFAFDLAFAFGIFFM